MLRSVENMEPRGRDKMLHKKYSGGPTSSSEVMSYVKCTIPLMRDEAVYRTAPATPGLLNMTDLQSFFVVVEISFYI